MPKNQLLLKLRQKTSCIFWTKEFKGTWCLKKNAKKQKIKEELEQLRLIDTLLGVLPLLQS